MENSDNEADEKCVMLILENFLDRVWLSVKPLTRRKRAQPKECKRNINNFRKAEGLSYKKNITYIKLPNNAYCLCWSEVNGKKGSCEIGTYLYYFLSKELLQSVNKHFF